MKRVMMLVAVVGGIVQMAVGVDTHDYSNYAKLATSKTSLTIEGGWPGADAWNPPGEMSESGYYLIQSGKTLTSKTTNESIFGGTWPCAELAVQGTFRPTATGGRECSAVIQHMALLEGGTLNLSSAYGTLYGDTLDIRGSAENPSVII